MDEIIKPINSSDTLEDGVSLANKIDRITENISLTMSKMSFCIGLSYSFLDEFIEEQKDNVVLREMVQKAEILRTRINVELKTKKEKH